MWVVGATCLGTVRSVAVAASLSHHWTHTSPRIPITTRPPIPLIPLARCILCGTEGSAWYIAITTIRLMRRVLENVPTWLPSMSKADAEAAQALVCAELSTDESKVCHPRPTHAHTRTRVCLVCSTLHGSDPCRRPAVRARGQVSDADDIVRVMYSEFDKSRIAGITKALAEGGRGTVPCYLMC